MTEKQQAFLDHLFDDDVRGNYRLAARKAGYSDDTSISSITAPLEEQIIEVSRKYIARMSVEAAVAMSDVLAKPHMPGTASKIAAAKDLMDRAGLKKPEKFEVDTKGGIFFLPEKKSQED